MICCEKERESCFCSDCGKRLKHDPIAEMINHCYGHVKAKEVSLGFLAAETEPLTEQQERRVEGLKNLRDKWQARGDAIVDLVKIAAELKTR